MRERAERTVEEKRLYSGTTSSVSTCRESEHGKALAELQPPLLLDQPIEIAAAGEDRRVAFSHRAENGEVGAGANFPA